MNDNNFNIGSINPSGIGETVFLIPKRNIRRWPVIVDDFEAAMQGHYAEYSGNFELQGSCWTVMYTTKGKGKISWEYLGEKDCAVAVNKATLSYPSFNNEVRSFAKYASNGDFVFVFKHDGKYYVIGHPDYRATITTNGDSGDTPGSAKGVTVEIECPDTTPLPTYTGIIITKDGILDCATDTFINNDDMNTNKIEDYSSRISDNSVRFDAIGKNGRIHLEGSGPILMEVSVDGEYYETVEHDVQFVNGVAEAPVAFYIGDKVRLSATTLTAVKINYNDVKTY